MPDETRDADDLIRELATSAAELGGLLHETVAMLAELLSDPGAGHGHRPHGGLTAGELLGADALEIATLQAQAAGVTVAAYVREAVLSHAAHGVHDGDREGDGARRRSAREESARVRSESRAVRAQSAQAAARAARLGAEAGDPADGTRTPLDQSAAARRERERER